MQGVRRLCGVVSVRRARLVRGGEQQGLSRGPYGASRCLHGLRVVCGDLSRQRHHGLPSKIRIDYGREGDKTDERQ